MKKDNEKTGKRYNDGCSGALVSGIGHGIPEVIEAVHKQMQELNFSHPSRWRNTATEEAAEAIAKYCYRCPYGLEYPACDHSLCA